jgi:glutamyl-tRNA reductase
LEVVVRFLEPALVAQPEKVSFRGNATEWKQSSQAGTSLLLVGTSFKTSTLAFREALARRLGRESGTLPRVLGAKEYAQLVTCNRIEMLMVVESAAKAEAAASAWLSKIPGMAPGSVYVHRNVDAITHLFRVAVGLDSLVVGEDQVLSQVRDAGVAARTSRSSRASLSAIFDVSVSVGRRARKELGRSDDSVSSAALRFALERLPRPPKSVLLIGTGKTTRLAANQLEGVRLYVATRRASLPSFSSATLVSHQNLRRFANRCELIVAATKHRGFVLKRGDLDERKRVILDLAFPRNVDPALNAGATEVYNLEDLSKLLTRPRPAGPEAARAEEKVASEAEEFSRWLLASRQSSAVSLVYRWAEATRRREAEAALRRLPGLSPRERKVVEAMARRLVSKLLAPATSFAKGSSPDLPQAQRLELVRRIFDQGEG